jgi:hypothetical protein
MCSLASRCNLTLANWQLLLLCSGFAQGIASAHTISAEFLCDVQRPKMLSMLGLASATPRLFVTLIACEEKEKAYLAMFRLIRSATRCAALRFVSGNNIRNSSPPNRAIMSDFRFCVNEHPTACGVKF